MVELWVDATIGNDSNPGSQDKPLQNPATALGKIGGNGDYIHLNGTFYNGLRLKQLKCIKPLIVDGHGKTLFWAFEGPQKEIDPSVGLPPGNWNNIDIMDCHNVKLKGMAVVGGQMQSLGLNDSYPNIGLKNIVLDSIIVKYGPQRGIFMGGNVIEGISIINCRVSQTIYGDVTHGIYLSGGHWNGQYPPVKNIKIQGCMVDYTGGRHCVQLNGRFDDVEIMNNEFKHGQIAGLSLIGTQNVKVAQNKMWGNNRWAMVIYDYIDSDYWNTTSPEEKAAWLACHHPNKNIYVYNNDLIQAYQPFRKDAWHPYDYPDKRAPIQINNSAQLTIPGFKGGNFVFGRNIVWSPWFNLIDFSNINEAVQTHVVENIMWTDQSTTPWIAPGVTLPYGDKYYSTSWLEENVPNLYKGNIIADPAFEQLPVYDFIDQTVIPNFNWDKHNSKASLKSEFAIQKEIGVTEINPWQKSEEVS